MTSTEAWRNCVEWLDRCQVIPYDHRLTRSNEARYADLAYYLKDGVVLCFLLNRLHPNAIDQKQFSQRPQHSQYLCRKNFRVFCDACKKVFGLAESDLFKPEELCELKDYEKIVNSLAKLSQTELARKSVASPFFTGFGQKIESDSSKEISNQRDSDLYDGMSEADIYDTFGDENEDEIYDVLMHDQLKTPTIEKSPSKSQKDMCINELICTEKKYLEILHIIETHFMEPLSSILERNDFEKIFLKIKELIKIHEGFYNNLCTATDSSKEESFQKSVADCFIMWKEKFLIYGEFCSNLSSAQDLIETLCATSPIFKATIEKCQFIATEGKFMFRDMLPVPMQRVLKYPLLLQEMVKATESSNTENKMLQRALEEMKDLSLYVNEVKRDNETLQLINEIEKTVVNLKMPEGTRLKDYGRLLMDGSLKVKSTSDSKTKQRNVFVFDKVIILCAPKGDLNEYKNCLIMLQYTLDDTVPIKDKAFAHGFILKNKTDSGLFYTFGAKSKDLRKNWIDVFELAQSNLNPPGSNANGHQFVMTSYSKPTICDVCRKLLRGVFFQGYKCQKTQMSAHKECIARASSMNGPPTTIPFGRRPSVTTQASNEKCRSSEQFTDVGTKFPKNARLGRRNTEPALPVCPPRLIRDTGRSLDTYPWFAGDLNREDATSRLERHRNGTFLVRQSDKGGFALSLMCDSVKHIKIRDTEGQFSLDGKVCFASIPDLVDYFKKTSLETSFTEVMTTLIYPIKEVHMQSVDEADDDTKYCQAIYDYSATESNQISFHIGDRIAIISKSFEVRGWWKGRLNSKTGFFPYSYVIEI